MILRGCECAEAFVGDVPGEAQPGLASRPSDFSIFNGKPKWLWTLNHSLREKTLGFVRIFSYSHHSRCAVLPGLMQGVGEQRSHWVFADVLGPQLMRNPFHPVAMGWWDCQVSWMSQDQWDRLGAAWVRLGPKSWYCISFVAAFQSISSHPFQNCYLP